MTLHYILCANEKKDQSEIGGMVGRARYLVSAVVHCRYLLPIQLMEEKSISSSLIVYHKTPLLSICNMTKISFAFLFRITMNFVYNRIGLFIFSLDKSKFISYNIL